VDLEDAVQSFERSLHHCDNLVSVHRGHGGKFPGRRHVEVSLNRAIVVTAVASWQSVVQDYSLAALELGRPGNEGAISESTYNVMTGSVKNAVGAFSTPNGPNVRRLLISAGFDPRPAWTWTQHGGQGQGMITWTPDNAERRIDEWLKIRHAIAHGHPTLPKVDALKAVRHCAGKPPDDPTLRLVDAEQCVAFFRRLARLTGTSLAANFGVSSPF
jgi:hypothetical protein